MPEISVIIPVYNSARYLRECLESVLGQTVHDIEIICINDGSTDESLQILHDFKHKDSRITIIDQKNAGVSAARNEGLAIASGKYVGFVDGDDTVSSDYFEKLIHEAERTGADAVYSRFAKDSASDFEKVLNGQGIISHLLPEFFKGDTYNSVCNKIFRTETVKAGGLAFPTGTALGEDAYFNIAFLVKAERIAILDYSGYHYREVPGSATRNIAKHDYLKRIVEVYRTDWKPVIGDLISGQDMLKLKKIRLVNAIISLIYIYGNRGNDLTDGQRFAKLHEIVQHSDIVQVFSDLQIGQELKLGKYAHSIFSQIRKKNVLYLYLLTRYSYYRNR